MGAAVRTSVLTLIHRLTANRGRALFAGSVVAGSVAIGGFYAFAQYPAGHPLASAPAPVLELTVQPTPSIVVGEDSAGSSFAGIAEPPPQPPKRTTFTTHVVQPGEVLWQLADQFQLRAETILWTNDIDDPDLILAGQRLLIPPVDGVLYTVRQGDHLAGVAERYGVDLAAIATLNSLSDLNQIQVGADLFLPGARPLRPALSADTVQAPPSADPEQEAAAVAAAIPLPDNIDLLLAAGWLNVDRQTTLLKTPDQNGKALHDLPAGARLERLDGFKAGRIEVRDPGDGRTRQAMTGWVSALDVGLGRAPAPRELPAAYPLDTAMDIAHVFAPYRTQLDGSSYSEANCGPATVAMALDAFGIHLPSNQVRAEALNAQGMWGNNAGTLITALAKVTQQHGLRTLNLFDSGGAIHRWSLDDLRSHVAQGHPVVVQARYRSLPGRGGAAYYGDHYILVTGVVPDGFLYNDAVDHDGIGWDRVMSADRLKTVMDASDKRYAYAAFAVAR